MLRKECYRDLDKWRKTKREQKRRYRERTGSHQFAPRPWTEEEDRIVIEHLFPDREISEMISRSVSSIQVRRHNLKNR